VRACVRVCVAQNKIPIDDIEEEPSTKTVEDPTKVPTFCVLIDRPLLASTINIMVHHQLDGTSLEFAYPLSYPSIAHDTHARCPILSVNMPK
jgi:hypothetical protein